MIVGELFMIGRLSFVLAAVTLMSCHPRTPAAACAFTDFAAAPYDHIIEQVPAVTTSEFAGRLRVRESVVKGGWPVGLGARIELHGPGRGGFSETLEVADDGTFARKDLRPGTYCFKISAPGFRSMTGTAVINHAVRRPTPLDIVLIVQD